MPDGTPIALNFDVFTTSALPHLNTSLFPYCFGTLDGEGQANPLPTMALAPIADLDSFREVRNVATAIINTPSGFVATNAVDWVFRDL